MTLTRSIVTHVFAVAAVNFFALTALAQYGSIDDLKIAKPEDKQDAKPTPAPEGAMVLLHDEKDLAANWEKRGGGKAEFEPKEGGAFQVKGGDIVSKEKFNEPIHVHVEFRTPYMPGAAGQGRGNSGVYLQGRYEVQVLDSYGIEKPQMNDCGAIYGVEIPTSNASKPPTVWQSYDIDFTPPKFDGEKKVEMGRMTVIQNGVKIHEDTKITTDNTTSGMGGDPKTPGPLMLQDHGNPVQFRNVWVQKIKK